MHLDEFWQIYYPNGEPIFGAGWESARGNPGASDSEIVGVVVVYFFRVFEGELEFLWQKRSEKVSRYPGYYDVSVGGHINLGETLVEAAVRETKEEIGIDLKSEELRFISMQPVVKNRFMWVFGVDFSGREDEFEFDDAEVSEVKWVKYAKTDEFRKKYAKPPLKKDDLAFLNFDHWLLMHGFLNKGNELKKDLRKSQ